MIKAYKYRLHPTKEQAEFFEKTFGCVRFVYNWALNQRIEAYQKDGTRISWLGSCRRLTELKKQEETKWLCEVPNQSLQQSIRNMDKAFTHFFAIRNAFQKIIQKNATKHHLVLFKVYQSILKLIG